MHARWQRANNEMMAVLNVHIIKSMDATGVRLMVEFDGTLLRLCKAEPSKPFGEIARVKPQHLEKWLNETTGSELQLDPSVGLVRLTKLNASTFELCAPGFQSVFSLRQLARTCPVS